nr:coiled-coil domain-containing protein 113-like [Nomia melanderi]
MNIGVHVTLIKKTRQQLVQREELGEALRAVDFEQLNIQNKDYVRMIEEKTIYVIDMKRIAGHYHLKLTQHKQKLSDLLSTLSNLKKEISQRDQQIEELRVEGKHVEKDVARMNEELGSLLNYMEHHSVPDILDFVNLQAEVQELQKEYKLLNRRKNIERIIFRTSQKQAQSRPSESDLQFARLID